MENSLFRKYCCSYWIFACEKKKKKKNLDRDLTLATKIDSELIMDLNVKCRTLKLWKILGLAMVFSTSVKNMIHEGQYCYVRLRCNTQLLLCQRHCWENKQTSHRWRNRIFAEHTSRIGLGGNKGRPTTRSGNGYLFRVLRQGSRPPRLVFHRRRWESLFWKKGAQGLSDGGRASQGGASCVVA